MTKSLWDASPKELLAIINIALISQTTISTKQDKMDWADLAQLAIDELNVRNIDTKVNSQQLFELT